VAFYLHYFVNALTVFVSESQGNTLLITLNPKGTKEINMNNQVSSFPLLSSGAAFQKAYRLCVVGAMLVLLTIVLSGCASLPSAGGDKNARPANLTESFPLVEPSSIAGFTDQDVFKVGDLADITVYNVENLTSTYIVNRSGEIDFPLIGRLKVAGLTTMTVQEMLTEKYGEQYLRNPNISVKIEPKKLGKIIVDGAVSEPGVFEVFEIINLSEAIALAGGVTIDANKKEVYVVREIDGKRQVRAVNLNDIRKLAGRDPKIYPNDLVFVQESGGRIAFREFLRTVPLLNTVAILSTRR
jgi:polysaccharide export outer membrane protein